MAERIIVWSSKAKIDLINLYEFYNYHNKSKTYSLKLHRKIQKEIKLLLKQPEIVKKTNKIGVRGLLIDNDYLFYEIFQEHIVVLAVWENSQNPSKLKP
jgi:plasmid stabilization system protein ParE